MARSFTSSLVRFFGSRIETSSSTFLLPSNVPSPPPEIEVSSAENIGPNSAVSTVNHVLKGAPEPEELSSQTQVQPKRFNERITGSLLAFASGHADFPRDDGSLLCFRIGDIVLSANGVSFENVDYSRAVNVLRESETMVNLLIKRRLNPNCVSGAQNMLSVQLQRSKKKEDFGIVLGCQVYIKEIAPRSIAHQDNTLKAGDIVLKVCWRSKLGSVEVCGR